jgi:hypothetical protein
MILKSDGSSVLLTVIIIDKAGIFFLPPEYFSYLSSRTISNGLNRRRLLQVYRSRERILAPGGQHTWPQPISMLSENLSVTAQCLLVKDSDSQNPKVLSSGTSIAFLFLNPTRRRKTDMSLSISGNYRSFPAPAANSVVSSHGDKGNVNSCTSDTGDDAVQVSAEGRLLASTLMQDLILPTEENVRRLSAALSEDLGNFLNESGISAQPPIEIGIDWNSGNIQVKGDRADSEKIESLINGNEKIKGQIRDLEAISSHAAAMADSLKFQEEYLASSNPESVVAKYSYLFSSHRQSDSISLLFDGNSVQVKSNGEQWISSKT